MGGVLSHVQMEEREGRRLVPVFFYGKQYFVPESCTIIQAYEFAGHTFTRGCGCRAGACGACAALFLIPGSAAIKVGLACQTQVTPGMSVIQIPYFPTLKAAYELETLSADPFHIPETYPKLLACMGCNTCRKMCPQEINVMDCMSAALQGDIEAVALQSMSCVMCGMCAARCPADIAPYHIMLLARRVYGRFILKPYRYLPVRLKQIEDGTAEKELEKLMALDITGLKEVYKKQQADKRII